MGHKKKYIYINIHRTRGKAIIGMALRAIKKKKKKKKEIYIYIYSSNPWESNHRDGPTGHNNHTTNCTSIASS